MPAGTGSERAAEPAAGVRPRAGGAEPIAVARFTAPLIARFIARFIAPFIAPLIAPFIDRVPTRPDTFPDTETFP